MEERYNKIFLLFYLFFRFYFILLYNTVLVLPYINMNPPRVYTCSQSWTPLPPPSPYHLSGSSQCTSPKHPVSCIEPRLAIHFLYDIIHVSMPVSQIIPPSPSPRVQKTVLYHCVSLLSQLHGYRYHLSKLHICREPAWEIPPMTRSCGEAWWARLVSPQGFRLDFPEHLPPKNPESACFTVLSTLLTFSGKS